MTYICVTRLQCVTTGSKRDDRSIYLQFLTTRICIHSLPITELDCLIATLSNVNLIAIIYFVAIQLPPMNANNILLQIGNYFRTRCRIQPINSILMVMWSIYWHSRPPGVYSMTPSGRRGSPIKYYPTFSGKYMTAHLSHHVIKYKDIMNNASLYNFDNSYELSSWPTL